MKISSLASALFIVSNAVSAAEVLSTSSSYLRRNDNANDIEKMHDDPETKVSSEGHRMLPKKIRVSDHQWSNYKWNTGVTNSITVKDKSREHDASTTESNTDSITLDDTDEDDDDAIEPTTRRRTRKLSTTETNNQSTDQQYTEETVVSKTEIISMDEIENLSLEDLIQEVETLENELKKQARVKEEKAKAISNLIKEDLPALRAEVDFNTHLFDKAKDIGDEYINYYKPIQEEGDENDVGLEF